MNKFDLLLTESLKTGFIDKEHLSELQYQPELLTNQKNPPKKILSTLINELSTCTEFYISVAFLTTSGVATIINQLKNIEKKGIKGKLLVSQYLNFTQPEALKRVLQFKNIEVRILTSGNAHAKGYIFKHDNYFNLIVGSSNLTATALCTNKEWNIKLSAKNESGIVSNIIQEFWKDFESATSVTTDFIEQYRKLYEQQFITSEILAETNSDSEDYITPNLMQSDALTNLSNLRLEGKNKALIISATGTGKTYLAAFDAKKFNPNKLLFVVHSLKIAQDALKTFKKVFGATKSMGLYSGQNKDLESDFLFATVQTISKSEHLSLFNEAYFDYVIIDETHRSAAESYLKLLEYFTPKFLLGMTATPERTDGNDIFKQFDHNIAYEIRLNKALEEDMLSTFHYYGVTDVIVDDKILENNSDFNLLLSNERVERIIEQSNFYGCDNGILRGLIFCSRKEEAKLLAHALTLKGKKTIALTGDNSDKERANTIALLESDDLHEKIDYIITVDIFNEGIDIPKVNQIIMLRPTESAIIFVQQLGRGLRKAEGKGYLTVIDFIGNYENNYMIPIALFGDRTYNKDTIRRLLNDGSRMIPGASTINFDEITKDRIFQSIDAAKLMLLTDLKRDFSLLKYRLGRIPMMMDFIQNDSRDPYQFVEYSKSYWNFVIKTEKDFINDLNTEQVLLLELFAKEINNGKRVLESEIINQLINKEQVTFDKINQYITSKYGFSITTETYQSCINNLNFSFVRKTKEVVVELNNELQLTPSFMKHLRNETFKQFLQDNIDYGIYSFESKYSFNLYKDGFILFQKYSRKDVCRILNWQFNEEATVYGYKLTNNSCPIFVNYHKEENIASSTKFPEKFLNPSQFLWYSKPKRKLSNSTIIAIRKQENNLRLPFFIKKHNGEGTDFYYMGDVSPIDSTFEQTTIKNDHNKDEDVVKVVLQIEKPIDSSLYNYITDHNNVHNVSENEVVESVKDEIIDHEFETIKIPLFNFYAAAGSFSELQFDHEYSLIDAPTTLKEPSSFFACKVIGESMNKVIPNGAICLFKKYSGGSRNGKIVLVENLDWQDIDFNSAFTVKTYTSSKIITEEGWQHTEIRLKPNSTELTYSDIIINEENAQNMKVIGEFIRIL